MSRFQCLARRNPAQDITPLPRCEAELENQENRAWRKANGRDTICSHKARYLIDGKKLCTRHAGNLVLDMLEKGEFIS